MTWCWHFWSKWVDDAETLKVTRRVFRDPKQDTAIIREFLVQRRRCSRCGKVKIRREIVFDVSPTAGNL